METDQLGTKLLHIECSPRTLGKPPDQQFVNVEAIDDYEEEVSVKIEDISVSETSADIPDQANLDETCETAFKKQSWLEAPTKLLLTLYSSMLPQLKSANIKNKQKMWQIISEKLAESGYNFTEIQVQTKFRTLERKFKKTKMQNAKTGQYRITCPIQREFSNILDSKKAVGISKKKRLPKDLISGTIDASASKKGKNSFHEEIFRKRLNFLELKEKRENSRDERSQRKLALLEKIEESLRRQ